METFALGNSFFCVLFSLALFGGMLGFQEIGRRIGVRCKAADPEGAFQGTGVIEGAVFGVLGLLISFTFSGAASRFDSRRALIAQESNAIGTAYLRLDLLSDEYKKPLQDLFRRYLDSRLKIYRNVANLTVRTAETAGSESLQREIWTLAVKGSRVSQSNPTEILLLPAINEMIDITTTRSMAALIHPPLIVFILLFVLSLCSSMMEGYCLSGGKRRSWMHLIGFALVTTLIVYVILDMEFPRLGFIRIDSADQVMVQLRATMN